MLLDVQRVAKFPSFYDVIKFVSNRDETNYPVFQWRRSKWSQVFWCRRWTSLWKFKRPAAKLSLSPARTNNNNMGSPDIAVPSDATTNMSPVAMQNEIEMKVAEVSAGASS